MRIRACILGLLLVLPVVPALADSADFLGVWRAPDGDPSGIARVVVSPGEGRRLTVHVFGACAAGACDWGASPARLYADGPDSQEIGSIAAEFDAGGAHRRLTFHLSVAHALRIDMQTDFAANAGRGDYATSTAVAYAGEWNEAPRVATAAAPGQAPVAAAPPESSGWFGGSGLIGLGSRTPQGYQAAAGEDCTPFNPAEVRASNTDGSWRLGDFSHRLENFGSHHEDALRGQALLAYYHFDEECVVARDSRTMLYWKRAGLVPKESLRGEVCVALDPAAVKAVQNDGGWSVASGLAVLLDFGDDKAGAERAASVIHTYKLNRQCFAGPPKSGLQYWLAQ